MLAFLFTAPLVAIAPLRSPVQILYFAVLVEMYIATAMAYVLAAAFTSTDASNLFGVNAAVIMCVAAAVGER